MNERNKQEQIWFESIEGVKLSELEEQYNNPAEFQICMKEVVNSYIEKNYYNVIEVGCEMGITSTLVSDSYNKTYLDYNPKALTLANDLCSKLNKKGNFIVADMFNMPFNENSFDLVFNSGVLEHYYSKQIISAFLEYKRILRENGRMVIAFPNHYSIPYRSGYLFRRLLHILKIKKWPYPKEMKLYDLSEEISQSGLVLEKRMTCAKQTIFQIWNKIPLIKELFRLLDKVFDYEGYLTILIIKK